MYFSMLGARGVAIEKYSDSNGKLAELSASLEAYRRNPNVTGM
jgi:hypothetical protein